MRILSPIEGLAPNPNAMTDTNRSGRLHSGHAYLEFDQVATRIFERLRLRRVGGFGFPENLLHERIVQRANEVLLVPFVDWFESVGTGTNAGSEGCTGVIAGRYGSMDIRSGRLTLSLLQKWACWREFLVPWLKILLFTALPKRPNSSAVTGKNSCLLYGVGKESLIVNGTDSRFAEYLAVTSIAPLRNAQMIVVESSETPTSSNPNLLAYARDPLLFTWRQNRLALGQLIGFLVNHLVLPFQLWRNSRKNPEVLLIARDIAFIAMIEYMDHERMIGDVIYTSSNLFSQPLWLRSARNFKLHMAHYSQAVQVFAYAADKLQSDLPQLRWLRCDVHWVWTEGFAKYIAKHNPTSKIHVIGPIIWHKQSRHKAKKLGIVLTAFDVPALSDAIARSCGELTNFWKLENLKGFIDDLIRLRAELQIDSGGEVKLVLKMKRISPAYDQGYAEYVNRKSTEHQLELLPINENIFDLISSSDIVIVFPYSTPAYVASNQRIPAIYYDPTKLLMPTFEAADGIWFASGYDELIGRCRMILVKPVANGSTMQS